MVHNHGYYGTKSGLVWYLFSGRLFLMVFNLLWILISPIKTLCKLIKTKSEKIVILNLKDLIIRNNEIIICFFKSQFPSLTHQDSEERDLTKADGLESLDYFVIMFESINPTMFLYHVQIYLDS